MRNPCLSQRHFSVPAQSGETALLYKSRHSSHDPLQNSTRWQGWRDGWKCWDDDSVAHVT